MMEHNADSVTRQLARRSALTYSTFSIAVALAFFLLATVAGDYTSVARFGGALWVFILSLIVTMPLVTGRYQQHSNQ